MRPVLRFVFSFAKAWALGIAAVIALAVWIVFDIHGGLVLAFWIFLAIGTLTNLYNQRPA